MVNVNSLFILTGVIGFKSRVDWLTGYNFILGFVHGASGHCIVDAIRKSGCIQIMASTMFWLAFSKVALMAEIQSVRRLPALVHR